MATAEKKATTTEELYLLLSGDPMPVSEVLAKIDEGVLASAWARGDVEFGRACHCVTGRPGVPESKPTLIIEDGMSWSGQKTPRHKNFRGVLADASKLPACQQFRKYVKQVSKGKDSQGFEHWQTAEDVPEGVEFRWVTEPMEQSEAKKALALWVKLTDKGMAALQA